MRVRAILRAVRRQGHAHPAQRTYFEGVRHRRGGRKSKRFSGAKASRFSPAQGLRVDAKREGKIENRFVRARRQNGFRFRRGNSVRAGPRAEHGVAGFGKGRRENRKRPHHRQRVHANQRAAHLHGGRLHRAARNRPHRRPAGRNRRAQHRQSKLAAPDGLPAADFGRVHRTAGGVCRFDGKGSDGARNSISGGELSVQRPRQIAHHGGKGRFRETAGGPEIRRNSRRQLRRAGRRRTASTKSSRRWRSA